MPGAHHLLAAVVESSDAAIVTTDPDWLVRTWNPAAERLFGYAAAEVVGRSILELVPPDQHAEARRVMERVRAGGRVLPYEAVRARKGGASVPVCVNPWPVRDAAGAFVGLAAVYTDLSQRRRAEAELRGRDELLRSVIAHIPCGVFWKDRAGVYLGCNELFARNFGLASPAEVVGRTDYDLGVSPAEAEFYRACDRRVVETGEPLLDVEEPLTRLDGSAAVLLTSKVPLRDAAGTAVGVLGIYQDVTDRKAMEEQLRQATKMEAVGRLAGGVAHDFNNLLTVINGYSEVLLGNLPDGDPNRELVAEVRAAGERSAALTRQLLAFGRKQVVRPQLLDLAELVRGAAGLLRRVIGEDVLLEAHLAPDPVTVRADPVQLEQVLLNLVVNARDAMPRGGRLTVAVRRGEAGAVLEVSDTGVGMTEEVRAKAFEPFFTTKGPGKGTGLGLATVYGIVQQSGGRVELETAPGRGATFRVHLPFAAGRPQAAPARGPEVRAAGRGETVLLVEDEAPVRMLALHALQEAGYSVLEAEDGRQALRLVAAYAVPVHLLVTDVVMPNVGGGELAGQLTAMIPALRVLYVSGYADDELVRRGVRQAGAHFLPKPYTPAELARKVREVLDRPAP